MTNLVCIHCEERVEWNRYLEDWMCGGCRTSDVKSLDDEEGEP